MAPRRQFCLMVTRGRRTSYHWGERLKDLLCHVKEHEEFQYTKYVRGPVFNAAKFGSGNNLSLAVKRATAT